ncbi:lysosome membrane protein 2-like isoform X1, partial [Dinothrombium tinctorium]
MNYVRIVLFCLLAIGFFCLLLGLMSQLFINKIIKYQLAKRLPLLNGTETLHKWSNVKLPVYMNYRLFHVKNAEEVLQGKKPIFEERGPYVFRERIQKEVIDWNEDETLISYRTRKSYYFDAELSVGDLTENVTIVNVPLISLVTVIMEKAQSIGWFAAWGAKKALNSMIEEEPLVTKTVEELLYGYTPKFYDKLSTVSPFLPFTLPDKFGFMYKKNNTAEGVWKIYTGKSDLNKIGSVVTWNNLTHLSCWNGTSCNKIEGTDGTMFHPFISPEEKFYLFNADVNRSLALAFERNSQVHSLNSYRYVLPKEFFTAPNVSGENSCYCVNKPVENEQNLCAIDGVLDVSKCKRNLPIVISLPHFYEASKILLESAQGLKPEKEKHEIFMEFDPISGVILKAARRLQLNVNLKKSFDIDALSQVKPMIYPVVWFEETVTMDAKTAADLKSKLHDKMSLLSNIFYGVTIFGAVLMLVSMIFLVKIFVGEKRRNQTALEQKKYSYSNLKVNDENKGNEEQQKID